METLAIPNCLKCKIAECASGMSIQSTIPGDVIAIEIVSSNTSISAQTSLSLTLQFYAGIPEGGKLSIYLPKEIVPTFPLLCENQYGFNFLDDNPATCIYNSSSNRIDTVNFFTPPFYNTGFGVISIQVINPPDTRPSKLSFETYDNSSRQIGKSRSNTIYNATPLPLNVYVSKTSQQVSTAYNLTCNLTLSQMISSLQNFIEVILPGYDDNLSSIGCFQNGTNINCSPKFDNSSQLHITFPPPCLSCPPLTVISIVVSNLINPAFINNKNQQVIVNTESS
jgi:hypothetical protein